MKDTKKRNGLTYIELLLILAVLGLALSICVGHSARGPAPDKIGTVVY